MRYVIDIEATRYWPYAQECYTTYSRYNKWNYPTVAASIDKLAIILHIEKIFSFVGH